MECLHPTLLDQPFRILGPKKFYESIDTMQTYLYTFLIH